MFPPLVSFLSSPAIQPRGEEYGFADDVSNISKKLKVQLDKGDGCDINIILNILGRINNKIKQELRERYLKNKFKKSAAWTAYNNSKEAADERLCSLGGASQKEYLSHLLGQSSTFLDLFTSHMATNFAMKVTIRNAVMFCALW